MSGTFSAVDKFNNMSWTALVILRKFANHTYKQKSLSSNVKAYQIF